MHEESKLNESRMDETRVLVNFTIYLEMIHFEFNINYVKEYLHVHSAELSLSIPI